MYSGLASSRKSLTERFGRHLNLAFGITKSMTERFGHYFVMRCTKPAVAKWQKRAGKNV
jgi:hypothetical protein